VEAVAAELSMLAERHGWMRPWQLETVYCGGGTPSLLGPASMARLRDRLSEVVYWDESAEWTCEANPESFSSVTAREWRAAGVNRISLGAQTFSEPVLRWMGRLHGPDGPAAAVAAARSAGIENVSVDLIFGLPRRLGRDWTADLARLEALAPEHVSLYGLTAEPATTLGSRVREGKEVLADESEYAVEYLEAVATLECWGYTAYEVSNFARPGRESRHNQAYWEGRAYLGLGPAAHSSLPPERWWNVREWTDYRQRVHAGLDLVAGREVVDGDAALLETLWLGLRQRGGVELAGLSGPQRALAATWRDQGWARHEPARLRLTPEGWLRLDALTVALAAA